MPKTSKISVALIGLGHIAQKAYLPILATHPDVDPVLCTRDTQTLNHLARQYRTDNIFSSLDDLIRSKPDAAMVHSSTESHAAILLQLLKADIPVFVDKPLSYSLEETEQVIAAASSKDLPLYLGFNRRFAPLIQSLTDESEPIQISWQKNRVDLPGDPRVFIFDDFIHVVDSLRFLGQGSVQNLSVFSRLNGGMLENIQVSWQQGGTLMLGGMNRISGKTEEKVEYFTEGNKWVVENLNSGIHFADEKEMTLTFDPWDSALYQRGFVDMIDDWLQVVKEGSYDPQTYEDILESHRLCERILEQVDAG